jgi:membrane protein
MPSLRRSSINDMLGESGAKALEAMLAEASPPAAGILATILGIRGRRFVVVLIWVYS